MIFMRMSAKFFATGGPHNASELKSKIINTLIDFLEMKLFLTQYQIRFKSFYFILMFMNRTFIIISKIHWPHNLLASLCYRVYMKWLSLYYLLVILKTDTDVKIK